MYRFLTDVEIGKCNYESYPCILVRKSMDVNEDQRLSNFTLGHKCKFRNIALIAVLHFTVTVWSSIINKTHDKMSVKRLLTRSYSITKLYNGMVFTIFTITDIMYWQKQKQKQNKKTKKRNKTKQKQKITTKQTN